MTSRSFKGCNLEGRRNRPQKLAAAIYDRNKTEKGGRLSSPLEKKKDKDRGKLAAQEVGEETIRTIFF